jgi:hypothetical protein
MAIIIGFFVLLIIFILAVCVYFTKPAPTDTLDGICARPILSPPELAFYKQLCRSLPNLLVFPQVAANAILEVDKNLPKPKKTALRNRYSQWHIDFTICELESLKIVALVEFDGKRHNADNDAWRDKVLAQGGYTVHRFRAKNNYSDAEIAACFEPK